MRVLILFACAIYFIRAHSGLLIRSKKYDWSLAPMMKHTHGHYRSFIRILSPSCNLFTEMLTSHELLEASDINVIDNMLFYSQHERNNPPILQFGGRDPNRLQKAVQVAVNHSKYPHNRFNLNVGCPSNTIAGVNQFGCALMLESDLTAECCLMMKEAIPNGGELSVKCRIGVDDQDSFDNLYRFIDVVHNKGLVDEIQIHARKALLGQTPMKNREIPPLNYNFVYDIARCFPKCKIVINGGIISAIAAIEHLNNCPQLGGVMVGRAVINHPYSFVGLDRKLEEIHTGGTSIISSVKTRREILQCYIEYVNDVSSSRKVTPAEVSKSLAPVYCLFNGELGNQKFQRKISLMAKRGVSNAGLILSEAKKEIDPDVLDKTSFVPIDELNSANPWIHLMKKTNAPMKLNIQ